MISGETLRIRKDYIQQRAFVDCEVCYYGMIKKLMIFQQLSIYKQ